MPSRKQRRRREKLKRHEYEYVVETEEGEIPVERPRKDGKKDARAQPSGPVDRRGRPIPKPSLQRVLKRAAIFAPLLFAFVYLTSGDELSTAGMLLTVAYLLVIFMPFSYLVDVVVYRMVMRRYQRERETGR